MWNLTNDWYQKRGVDLYKDQVQIACSAHAINGGILIDENAQSTLPGLYAAGEVAAGPHGADRLGGNMSVTCQVFGARAGRHAARHATALKQLPVLNLTGRIAETVSGRHRENGSTAPAEIRQQLQKLANRYLLVIRTAEGLDHLVLACAELRELLHEKTTIAGPDDLRAAIEIDNMLDVCGLMARSARLRNESRGSHYREDFPATDSAQDTSIILDRTVPGGYLRQSLARR
jgi:L-aspartate oxidase